MARFDKGYFKAWRSMYDGDLADNPILFSLWNSLLHMAMWKEGSIVWDGGRKTLPPGSVVFGMREFAIRWGVSSKTIFKWIHYLQETGRITLETGTRGSIATICNWDVYQSNEDLEETRGKHEVNAEETPSKNQVNLSKEGKKERKKDNAWFDSALAEYKKLPGVKKGPKAEQRFGEQIKTGSDFESLLSAIKNYSEFLSRSENSWRKPKTTFDTFLGSKASGYFWRDFIQSDAQTQKQAKTLGTLEDLLGGQKNAS